MIRPHSIFSCLAFIIFLTPASLQATEPDQVLQSIEQAIQQYKKGNYTAAVSSLDFAGKLIRQKKGVAITEILPEPLEHWTMEQRKSETIPQGMMGGGLMAEQKYAREDSEITISIQTDSPLLQGIAMMLSNPFFAASAGKLELINGQQAIVDYANNGGTINMVVNNRFLVTVTGHKVERADLIAYAKEINLIELTKTP